MKLTDITLRTLKAPEKGAIVYADDTLTGFGVRVSQAGTKSYVLTHGPRRERETIGRVGIIKLAAARETARQLLAEYTLGKRRPSARTWDVATKEYLDHIKRTRKPTTFKSYSYSLKHFRFGATKLNDLTPQDLTRKLGKLTDRPSEHSHAFAVLRSFIRWAYRAHYLDRNPMERMKAPDHGPTRERVLSPVELYRVWNCSRNGTNAFHRIVALLCLLGQRRTLTAGLERAWLKDSLITVPGAYSKNDQEHVFPVGPIAIEILESLPVIDDSLYFFPAARGEGHFNGWSKAKEAFDLESKTSGWTLHDLRRTLRTNWAAIGVSKSVAEKFLNHISGENSGVNAIYDRHSYLPEMREAVAKWEQYLSQLSETGTVPSP